MNSEKPASRMNPMASQKTRPRTTSSNRSARKQTATSPAEPAPRFDELPTAERNAKTVKDEHQKSPEAQEQERREQYLWNRKVEAALKMAKEIKAAARIREVTAKVMESAGSRKSRGVKRSVADIGHKNHMDYKQKMKMTESRMEASSVTEYGYLKPRL
eukprot:jgi/Phyca11/16675/fgenesh1_pg.PHYCAscaffold_21_\